MARGITSLTPRWARMGSPRLRVELPIEIVEQGGDAPLELVLAQLPGVGDDAGLDGERVLAQSLGLGEFADDIPGLFTSQHEFHDSGKLGATQRVPRLPAQRNELRVQVTNLCGPEPSNVSWVNVDNEPRTHDHVGDWCVPGGTGGPGLPPGRARSPKWDSRQLARFLQLST